MELNKELVASVLAFGADVEVVSPPALREQMQRELQKAYSRYLG